MHCQDFQTKVVQSKGWLSAIVCCSMAKGMGSLEKSKVRGLLPCCGQDGYRAQLPQLPIDSYLHLTSNWTKMQIFVFIFMVKN